MRSKEMSEKIAKAAKALQEDILNSTSHCFRSHHKCKAEYCKKVRALGSPTDKKIPQGSDTSFFSGNDSSSSTTESIDVSLDPSSSFTSTSDDASTGSSASLNLSEDTTEDDGLTTLLLEQQMAWEDATTDTPVDVQIEIRLV